MDSLLGREAEALSVVDMHTLTVVTENPS